MCLLVYVLCMFIWQAPADISSGSLSEQQPSEGAPPIEQPSEGAQLVSVCQYVVIVVCVCA